MGRLRGSLASVVLSTQLCWGCATAPQPVSAIFKSRFVSEDSNSLSLSGPALQSGEAAAIPPGYVSFCIREPGQCLPPADPDQRVILGQDTWHTIQKINDTVNQTITPRDDLHHYGREEYWTIPTDDIGDCEDYVLAKRKLLMEAGLPVAALRIAIVDAPREGRHAVLTIVTDRGDYVLDNLRDEILPWNNTGFVWIERQDISRRTGWATLHTTTRQFQVAGR